jgi:hypothetical protein
MKTPLGWARAQLIADHLVKPPPYGSLLELMCLVVQRERAQLRVLGARAQAQAALGGESAEAAFKDFVNASNRVETEDVKKRLQVQLEKLKEIKEIRFKPMEVTGKQLKLPKVTAGQLREAGVLTDQMRPAGLPQRPQRARTQRISR